MSHNLLSYKEARIAALLDEVNRLKLENEKLTTFIFELCDKDCPRIQKSSSVRCLSTKLDI